MSQTQSVLIMRRHDLNNLLGKILGAAELALDEACAPQVRNELETIIRLAEEGGRLLDSVQFHPAR
jgi:hypothetical protein